jgi:hypothetical protein
MFESVGTLHYEIKDANCKLIVRIDQAISNYYRSLIPKWIPNNPQAYPAHISVVRKEIPPHLQYWGKYEGEKITFWYEPTIHEGTVYFWLNVYCLRLEAIRTELGLPVHSPYTLPPEGFNKVFHTTIANKKAL